MTTVREFLTTRYNELHRVMIKYISADLFPPIEGNGFDNFVNFLSFHFKCNTDYHEELRDLIEMNGVQLSENDYNLLYPAVRDFLDIFFKLLK